MSHKDSEPEADIKLIIFRRDCTSKLRVPTQDLAAFDGSANTNVNMAHTAHELSGRRCQRVASGPVTEDTVVPMDVPRLDLMPQKRRLCLIGRSKISQRYARGVGVGHVHAVVHHIRRSLCLSTDHLVLADYPLHYKAIDIRTVRLDRLSVDQELNDVLAGISSAGTNDSVGVLIRPAPQGNMPKIFALLSQLTSSLPVELVDVGGCAACP